jgi:hypothetical protein
MTAGRQTESLMSALFSITSDIRLCRGCPWAGGRASPAKGVEPASSAESDRYEELLVNPTLVTLARRRGEIDCGGLRYLLVGYGNFHQLVIPTARGHVSIAFERTADPLGSLENVMEVLLAGGALP